MSRISTTPRPTPVRSPWAIIVTAATSDPGRAVGRCLAGCALAALQARRGTGTPQTTDCGSCR